MNIINTLKENNQDFEFYPTTPEIINIIKRHIGTNRSDDSVLDCGAGNGNTLSSLTEGKNMQLKKVKF